MIKKIKFNLKRKLRKRNSFFFIFQFSRNKVEKILSCIKYYYYSNSKLDYIGGGLIIKIKKST